MPRPNATQQEIDDLIKYDGVYHKITTSDIEHGCFCSLGSCVEEFETFGEIVIETYSNLFHVKCFLKFDKNMKIKKPTFIENGNQS